MGLILALSAQVLWSKPVFTGLKGHIRLLENKASESLRHSEALKNTESGLRAARRALPGPRASLCSASSASASPSTWGRRASRSATPAGSCTAWSTAFSPTARCPATRPSAAAMTPSTRSSARPGPASTCPGPCSWTWSPPWSVGTLPLGKGSPEPSSGASSQKPDVVSEGSGHPGDARRSPQSPGDPSHRGRPGQSGRHPSRVAGPAQGRPGWSGRCGREAQTEPPGCSCPLGTGHAGACSGLTDPPGAEDGRWGVCVWETPGRPDPRAGRSGAGLQTGGSRSRPRG